MTVEQFFAWVNHNRRLAKDFEAIIPSATTFPHAARIMNVAYMSAFSALAGSAIGGVASIATSWPTQHSQGRAQRHAQSVGRRERLYGDLIDEASTLFVDALTHEQLDPSKFVQIYATIGKLRLFASADVVSEAAKIMQNISESSFLNFLQ